MHAVLRTLAFVLLVAGVAGSAQAGLFDDDEARRQLTEHKKQTQSALDTQARAHLDLANQITALNEELARLRGQIETLNYELENARKRQQDLYVDIDSRVRQLETPPKSAAKEESPASPSAATTADPAQENSTYEAALALFRASKFKEAAVAFEGFLANYGKGTLAANAQFWMANTWAAQSHCKKAIELQLNGLEKWPNSNKAPDAMLAIAGCQKDLGQAGEARKTLEDLVRSFPNSAPAEAARQRLGKK